MSDNSLFRWFMEEALTASYVDLKYNEISLTAGFVWYVCYV